MVGVKFELPGDQAQALAQMLKRIDLSDIRALACSDVEAEEMQYALINLKHCLKELGYDPR
jgi:hypothetical protein